MSDTVADNITDKLKPFYDFKRVAEEYADKTSSDREQTIYGYHSIRSGDSGKPLSPQEQYMKELRESLDKFGEYLAKFIDKHPNIPIDIQPRYLDNNPDNPEEHHHPYHLEVKAQFGKKSEKVADILVSTFDYRGLPDITIQFGNREIYHDRFGKAYEKAQIEKICQQKSLLVEQKLQAKKSHKILNASPQPTLKYKAQSLLNNITKFFKKGPREE